jgi:hypothetical protein
MITHPPAGHADAGGLEFAMDTLSFHVHGNADSHGPWDAATARAGFHPAAMELG